MLAQRVVKSPDVYNCFRVVIIQMPAIKRPFLRCFFKKV